MDNNELKEKKYDIQHCCNSLLFHKNSVNHLCLLNDGRLSSSSSDRTLIIYSKEYIPMIKINDPKEIRFHTQLKNGNILFTNRIGEIKV